MSVRRYRRGAILAAAVGLWAAPRAFAGDTLTTLASFNGSDGLIPLGGVILAGNNLYGTTDEGGTNNDGTVFSVPVTGGTPTVLASFNGSNGLYPEAGLTLSGNTLYGTTEDGGGLYNAGAVFTVPITGGAPTVLASFNSSDGAHPIAGVTLSANTLYGATSTSQSNYGKLFSVPLTGGTPTVLATFNGSDGFNSVAPLTLSGNTLYGTSGGGGADSDGAVFSITLTGGTPKVLASFNGSNGAGADNGVILVGNTLYGTTDQGYANGKWNGPGGIISSVAAGDTTHLTALGVIQNNQGGTPLFAASNPFDTITPGASDILVKYTYYGDANLSGSVDASDYALIDNGYLNQLTGWYNGDFNYDGVVNGSDYTLIDNAFNMQGASLADQATPDAVATNQIAAGASVVADFGELSRAVPEPACLGMVCIGSLGLLLRRK